MPLSGLVNVFTRVPHIDPMKFICDLLRVKPKSERWHAHTYCPNRCMHSVRAQRERKKKKMARGQNRMRYGHLHVPSYIHDHITYGHFPWPITRILQQRNVCIFNYAMFETLTRASLPPTKTPPTLNCNNSASIVSNPAPSCPTEAYSTLKKGRLYPPKQMQTRHPSPTNSQHFAVSSAFIPYPPTHDTRRAQPKTKEHTNVLWTPKWKLEYNITFPPH